jgi:hemerythrin-like domain-containing protein
MRAAPRATPPAVRRLKDEHLAMASVLYSLRHALRRAQAGAGPDLALLAAILHYLREFPERLHHPKEDEFLFAPLHASIPAARALVDELTAEHVRGDSMIRGLGSLLEDCAGGRAGAQAAFAAAADAYAEFQWRHMAREEELLLPLALAHLGADDWARLDAAFRSNANPLAGLGPRRGVDRLFRRILDLAAAAPVAGGRA